MARELRRRPKHRSSLSGPEDLHEGEGQEQAEGLRSESEEAPRRDHEPGIPARLRTHEGGIFVESGETVQVHVGKAVRVNLVEPEAYTAREFPRGFPWSSPQSSNMRVLSRAPFCPQRIEGQTLPERPAGFRAERPGTAEIQAPLVASWQALNPEAYAETPERLLRLEPLEAFRATVTVLPP